MNGIELLKKIEQLRKSMIEVATERGLSSHESIEISRELDDLLNQYEKVKSLND